MRGCKGATTVHSEPSALLCSNTKRINIKLQKELRITKACLHNFDPLKPQFYTAKLGLQGCALFFLVLLENIDCEYSLEPPRRGDSNEYPQSMF